MSALVDIKNRAVAYVKDLYAREPARVNAAVLAVIAAVGVPLAIGGVPVAAVVVPVIGLLLGGEFTRRKVKPV